MREQAPQKHANGQSWSVGPYVRVGERPLWNRLYGTFESELRRAQEYPEGAKMTDAQCETLAWNLAYYVIWELRD